MWSRRPRMPSLVPRKRCSLAITVHVTVPLKGVNPKKADIFSTDVFIKARVACALGRESNIIR